MYEFCMTVTAAAYPMGLGWHGRRRHRWCAKRRLYDCLARRAHESGFAVANAQTGGGNARRQVSARVILPESGRLRTVSATGIKAFNTMNGMQ